MQEVIPCFGTVKYISNTIKFLIYYFWRIFVALLALVNMNLNFTIIKQIYFSYLLPSYEITEQMRQKIHTHNVVKYIIFSKHC